MINNCFRSQKEAHETLRAPANGRSEKVANLETAHRWERVTCLPIIACRQASAPGFIFTALGLLVDRCYIRSKLQDTNSRVED